MQLHADHKAPPPVRGAALGEVSLSLWFLQWGKRTWGITRTHPPPALWISFFVEAPALIWHHRDFRGICRPQPLGICGEEACKTSTRISSDRVYTAVPASSFTHLQNQTVGTLWPGNSAGWDLPNLCTQIEVLLPHTQARSWIRAPLAVENVFQSQLTRGLNKTPENCAAQQHSSWEVGRQTSLPSEQSQYRIWTFLVLCTGKGINS